MLPTGRSAVAGSGVAGARDAAQPAPSAALTVSATALASARRARPDRSSPAEPVTDPGDSVGALRLRQLERVVSDGEHGLERGRIGGESRNQMPVHVRDQIAEQRVVDLAGVERRA